MEVNLLGGDMGNLDFSGLQGLAQSVGNIGSTISNIGAQEKSKRDQAAEYRFAAESQKRNVELQTFIQNQATEFNANWSSPDFDRDGAAERMSSEIQEYYDINIRGAFDENQAARFEANVLYPTLGNQKNNVNNVIAGFDLQAGKDANWSVVTSVSSLISSGAKPTETLETGLDALERLYQAGEFRSEAIYQEQIHILKNNANSSYLNIALDELLNKGIEAKDVEGIINAINQKDPSLAGDYEGEVENMLLNLNTDTENNLFEYAKTENMKSALKSNILNKDIENDNAYKAKVSKLSLELDTLQKQDGLTVTSVLDKFDGLTDRFSNNARESWLDTAEIEEDNNLDDMFSSMMLDVRAGTSSVEDIEDSPKWGLYHNDLRARNMKIDLVKQAKTEHDDGIATALLDKYSTKTEGVAPNVSKELQGSLYYEQPSQKQKIEDKELLNSMYDDKFAKEVETAIKDGATENFKAKQNLQLQVSQEAKFFDLQQLVIKRNQSPEKEMREISNAYLRGEISGDDRKTLESLVGKYGPTQQIKDADTAIKEQAVLYAGGKENTTAVNHYYSTMWKAFTEELDRNEDQDSPDFVADTLKSFINDDSRIQAFMDYQYGKDSARDWIPGTDEKGNQSDFDQFVWTMYETAHHNPAGYMNVAYNLAVEGAKKELVKKFGDIPMTIFEDNHGPMFVVDNATLLPGIVDMFKEQYPDADPAKTTIALQYGVVPDSDNNQTALYVGVMDDKGSVFWHEYEKSRNIKVNKAEVLEQEKFAEMEAKVIGSPDAQVTVAEKAVTISIPSEKDIRANNSINKMTEADILNEIKNMKGMTTKGMQDYADSRRKDYKEAYAYLDQYLFPTK